jgi:hypothetical protein
MIVVYRSSMKDDYNILSESRFIMQQRVQAEVLLTSAYRWLQGLGFSSVNTILPILILSLYTTTLLPTTVSITEHIATYSDIGNTEGKNNTSRIHQVQTLHHLDTTPSRT